MPKRKSLSRNEQETIITRSADEMSWTVYTCDPVMIRRMERLVEKHGVSRREVDEFGREYQLPRTAVKLSIRVGPTDAQRAVMGERLRAITAARRNEQNPPEDRNG